MSDEEETKNPQVDEHVDIQALREMREGKQIKTTNQEYAFYFLYGLISSALPIVLYIKIYQLSLEEYGPLFVFLVVVASLLLSMAYDNVTNAVRIRLLKKLPQPPGKKGSKQENKEAKDAQRKLQESVTFYQSVSFSLLYNNLFYLALTVFLGFFLLRSISPLYNYVLSVGAASALVMLSSTSK